MIVVLDARIFWVAILTISGDNEITGGIPFLKFGVALHQLGVGEEAMVECSFFPVFFIINHFITHCDRGVVAGGLAAGLLAGRVRILRECCVFTEGDRGGLGST